MVSVRSAFKRRGGSVLFWPLTVTANDIRIGVLSVRFRVRGIRKCGISQPEIPRTLSHTHVTYTLVHRSKQEQGKARGGGPVPAWWLTDRQVGIRTRASVLRSSEK